VVALVERMVAVTPSSLADADAAAMDTATTA
jgi:hypothetical protein